MRVVIHMEGLAMEACLVSSLLFIYNVTYNDIYNDIYNEEVWKRLGIGDLH